MSGHHKWSDIRHKRQTRPITDVCGRAVGAPGWFDGYCKLPAGHKGDCDERETKGTRPFPHPHEGRGPRCLACGKPRGMHHPPPTATSLLPAGFDELQYTKDMLSKFEQIAQVQEEELAERRESQLNLLKMISELAKERNDLQDTLAINYEMYGDPEKLVQRAEKAERALEIMTRRKDEYVDELQQRDRELAECTVQLHDNDKHRLGLMCAEQTDKLNEIAAIISDSGNYVDGQWLALAIKDVLNGAGTD